MILTLTPNPSIDATMQLASPLQRGQVMRPTSVSQVAGGKGVNVAHALHLAERKSLALFPADEDDPFIALLKQAEIPFHSVPVNGGVRMNTTLTEPDGTTTKINGPGARITPATRETLEQELDKLLAFTDWLVIAGSLPPGAPKNWYTLLMERIRQTRPELKIAIDTSDNAIAEVGRGLECAAPTLIKPNGLELGQLTGQDGQAIERAALAGDISPVIAAASELITRGIQEVLVTLGEAGAALVTAHGAWFATPPPTVVLSTVGAGDSSLAGYLLARTEGASPADCLVRAVAYGSAAAGLPGTQLPSPHQLKIADIDVREFHLALLNSEEEQ
ncbi:1-phosphofructokinase family hexose kinase [Corynebacterium alimapuense]|uniref:1-phosphofructokinase n=1 Tax=Corynebacterium alimapuense TaxID=1576874 RepID=A0A3M8KA46_9CORY|nr:1-phosphofructokinase family hexose kinase [Corynebacterium alimapuense]RNE49328.1 1-phosphofructokinase [Corynebacterium alimapuense]